MGYLLTADKNVSGRKAWRFLGTNLKLVSVAIRNAGAIAVLSQNYRTAIPLGSLARMTLTLVAMWLLLAVSRLLSLPRILMFGPRESMPGGRNTAIRLLHSRRFAI